MLSRGLHQIYMGLAFPVSNIWKFELLLHGVVANMCKAFECQLLFSFHLFSLYKANSLVTVSQLRIYQLIQNPNALFNTLIRVFYTRICNEIE
jgi:hypothetical protein